jgi:hypothetical protein
MLRFFFSKSFSFNFTPPEWASKLNSLKNPANISDGRQFDPEQRCAAAGALEAATETLRPGPTSRSYRIVVFFFSCLVVVARSLYVYLLAVDE